MEAYDDQHQTFLIFTYISYETLVQSARILSRYHPAQDISVIHCYRTRYKIPISISMLFINPVSIKWQLFLQIVARFHVAERQSFRKTDMSLTLLPDFASQPKTHSKNMIIISHFNPKKSNLK